MSSRRLRVFLFSSLCVLALATAASRVGILCTLHDCQTSIELDTGAIHIVHVAKGHSQAFASSRIEWLHNDNWNFTGWQPKLERTTPGITYVCAPVWLLGLMVVVPLTFRRRKPSPGGSPQCRSCNYNLTGNTTGRCPECGAKITE